MQKNGQGLRQHMRVSAPNMEVLEIQLEGTAPYVQHRFSEKARKEIRDKQEAGPQSRKGKKREKRDFAAEYEAAIHRSKEGWFGIPAPCFRNAAISACRLVGFVMTLAKLTLFIEADGWAKDGTPLVKINLKPHEHESHVRLARGDTSIVVRPMWDRWSATVRVLYDADIFEVQDVLNLFQRVGLQVGIGEGRHDSKNSAGMGWGTFRVKSEAKRLAAI